MQVYKVKHGLYRNGLRPRVFTQKHPALSGASLDKGSQYFVGISRAEASFRNPHVCVTGRCALPGLESFVDMITIRPNPVIVASFSSF